MKNNTAHMFSCSFLFLTNKFVNFQYFKEKKILTEQWENPGK